MTTPLKLMMALVLALLVAGCGGSGDEAGSGGGGEAGGESTEIGVVEGKNKFDPEKVTVEGGEVTFTFNNTEDVPHNLHIVGNGVDEQTEVIGKGTEELTVELESGKTYQFWCDPHKEIGMTGTITVT